MDSINNLNLPENSSSFTNPADTLYSDSPKGFQKLRKVPFYKNKTIDLAVLAVVLFAIAGILAALSVTKGNKNIYSPLSRLTDGEKNADPFAAKTVANPLNGVLYTEEESSSWISNRPLGVMINNHIDARPHSGLINAEVVYEIVAEGGITRFLAFFLSDIPEKVGPIRSTREYYLVLVKENGDAMLMHEGYSPQALEAIQSWPVRSLQRGGASFINWRDNPRNVATEHTLYSNGKELVAYGNETLGWAGTRPVTSWKFKEELKPQPIEGECFAGDCKPITVDFWYEGDYSAIWKYDISTNTYLRFTGYDESGAPIPHVDQETKEQVRVKNLIVQFAVERSIVGDDKNRLEYELSGSGDGLVFRDGAVANITWTKSGRDERTMFYDASGKEFEFNRGKFWISLVPDRNKDLVRF